MTEVIPRLFVGSDDDFAKAKEKGFAICSCCKEGPNGHRSVLKYTTLAAPKGENYYAVERGKHIALNLIDADDPAWIPEPLVSRGLSFIKKHYDAGEEVLVHCNAGHSRGPTMALMFLRTIGEMPQPFMRSEKVFRTLYTPYDPAHGMRQYARMHW